jgi:5'-3' exonuclease
MYCMGDISSKLELTRRDLIDIALLSGSDYTEGYGMERNKTDGQQSRRSHASGVSLAGLLLCSIFGVGPVTSVEILCDFAPEDKNDDSGDEGYACWGGNLCLGDVGRSAWLYHH